MVHIETYEPKYKNDFIRLNKEWIESYFKIESSDILFAGISCSSRKIVADMLSAMARTLPINPLT